MSRILERLGLDRSGTVGGLTASVLLLTAIALGSRGFRDFDPALTHYAFAAVFATFAVAYRYSVWLGRPPTRRYLERSFELLRAQGFASAGARLMALLADGFALQRFVGRRSRMRWITHLCLSWGSTLAFAVTFPLVFGWLHFETDPRDAELYRAVIFGFAVRAFTVHSVTAALVFNALNLSAVAVIIGVILSLYRRLGEPGDVAIQSFGNDVMPLLLLFAVSATGLLLTVSARWLGGGGYPFLALTHAATVIALLLYLPFGKLFHVFQRPVQLAVAFYKQAGSLGPATRCLRCREPFAPAMHVADLKAVLAELRIEKGPDRMFQDVCPACRRRSVGLQQGRLLGRSEPTDRFAESEPESVEWRVANTGS